MATEVRVRSARRWAIRIVVVTLTLLVSAFVVTTAAANAEEEKIRIAVKGAINAQQEVGLPPANYAGGHMSDQAKEAIAAAGEAKLRKYFSGEQLDFALEALANNIIEQSTGEMRHLGAGVRNLAITSLSVDEDDANVASVTATGTVWAKFGLAEEGDGDIALSEPSNGMMFELTLNKIDGKWLVVEETMRFAPGESP